MISFVRELFAFAKENKKMWIVPLIGLFLILGALLVFTQGSVIAPFIYTLF